MNENAINEWNIKIWCLTQWNYIKKRNLLKQNYFFHRNLQFQKFIKTSPSVLPGCGTRTKLICPQPTSFPNHHTVVGEAPHNTHYTLVNSNLHQPLISFLYMIPSCKQYWKDVQTWCKVWNHIDTEFDY